MLKEIKETAKSNKIATTGDFNYPHIYSSNDTFGQSLKKQFLDTLSDCFLEPLVLEHTRGKAILLFLLKKQTAVNSEIESS